MTRGWFRVALLALLVLASPRAASAAPGQAAGVGDGVSAAVPPAAEEKPSRTGETLGALAKGNELTTLSLEAGTAAGETSRIITGETAERLVKPFGTIAKVLKTGQALDAYRRGDTAELYKLEGEAVVGSCVDLACGVVTGLATPLAGFGCKVAAAAADAVYEHCTGKSAGAELGTFLMERDQAANASAIDRFAEDKRKAQRAMSDAQQAQFVAADNANAQQAQLAVAAAPSAPAPDDGGALLATALLDGVVRASTMPPVPLAAPPPSPAVANPGLGPCHPGHNEARHPGGCHQAPVGGTSH